MEKVIEWWKSDIYKRFIHKKTLLYSVICTLFAMAKSPSKQLLWTKQFGTMFNIRL